MIPEKKKERDTELELQHERPIRFKKALMPARIEIIPIRCRVRTGKFDLAAVVFEEIRRNGQMLKDRDVLVISSKFAAIAEGRVVDLKTVKPGPRAKKLSSNYDIDPRVSELIIEESDSILGGVQGFLLAFSKGVLAPNAGIDRSNVPQGYAVLYPSDPYSTARRLRKDLLNSGRTTAQRGQSERVESLTYLGVILCDSRIAPARMGTTGVAISVAGFDPIEDLRGRPDLFGNKLKVTVRAVADQIASAAEIVMGESVDSIPVVIVRGARVSFLKRTNEKGMIIDPERCLIIQGLKNGSARLDR